MLFINMEEINGDLLERYAQGKCTVEEQQLVEAWLAEEHFPENLEQADHQIGQEIFLAVKSEQGLKVKSRRLNWFVYGGIAAALTLAVSLFIVKINVGTHRKQIVYTAPFGKTSTLSLPDSSKLLLQPGSVVSYPEQFTATERKVSLISGEVFFAIHHNPKQPFLLKSAGGEIKVLGTRFNVRNLKSSTAMRVVLTQGKISFKGKSGMEQILKPGEELLFDKNSQKILNTAVIDTNMVTSWKTGALQFNDTPMEEALELLGNQYGIQFKVSCKLDKPISGNFTGKPIVKILSLIQRGSDYRFRNDGAYIEIYK